MVPWFTASDYHEGWTWQGGAFELGFNLSWTLGPLTSANWANLSGRLHLPSDGLDSLIAAKDDLTTAYTTLPMSEMPHLKGDLAPYYYDWLAHPEYDEYWQTVCIEDSHPKIAVPALNIGGWYDIFLGGTMNNFTGMRNLGATEHARQGQRLVIGPWSHSGSPTSVAGEYNFGTRAGSAHMGLQAEMMRFYDYWLRGEENGVPDDRPIKIFVMGENVWRYEDEWPLSRATNADYFLHSGGKANTLNGDGSLSNESPANGEPPDVYVYNPASPVPTVGGGLCCDPAFMAPGAYDHRWVESREDVLVYSTPPLDQDIEVTGPIIVTLYATTSAIDTDFSAKLVDVYPDGYARNLTDGIIRARYRRSRNAAELIQPGQVYEYTIDLWATSNLFKKGHLIRLEISSSNFPRFDRNTNTGEAIGYDFHTVSALQHIHHSREYPSRVTLPIVGKG
ncbi:CocE/NonD family hydrolase [Dehalococcoidia bacterium]|nr:CocE/NonD family hydrolase [Dehalococcoidia bacterium]